MGRGISAGFEESITPSRSTNMMQTLGQVSRQPNSEAQETTAAPRRSLQRGGQQRGLLAPAE